MNNEEKAQRIVCFHCNQQYCKGLQTIKSCLKNKEVNNIIEMAQWKDEQFLEYLSCEYDSTSNSDEVRWALNRIKNLIDKDYQL